MIFNFGKKKKSHNVNDNEESASVKSNTSEIEVRQNIEKDSIEKENRVNETTNVENNLSDAEIRKRNSIDILKGRNIPHFGGLPCIETKENCLIRSNEEIAKRAIATIITIQIAMEINNGNEEIEEVKEFFTGILNSFGVMDELTEDEKKIFSLNVTEQELINMMWKYEAAWALLWALGLVENLDFPSNICDCEYAVRTISSHRNFEEFIASTNLREIDEILDEADLIYRYDWACVNARLKGERPPANMDSGVVVERHKGLNWLIGAYGSDDWDNVQANT